MKEPIDYLKEYDRQIAEDGLDIPELKKLRNKIYRFKDYNLTNEEYVLKHTLLTYINIIYTWNTFSFNQDTYDYLT